MRSIILLLFSVVVYCQEVAEIPYDLVFSLAEKFGPGSVLVRQAEPTKDFMINVTSNGVVIEPLLVESTGAVRLTLKRAFVGEGYLLTTNQPKGSMILRVTTKHIDFAKAVGVDGAYPIDQFLEFYQANRIVSAEVAKILGKEDDGKVCLSITATNHREFSGALGGKAFTTTNGCLDVQLDERDFGHGLVLKLDKTDLEFSSPAPQASQAKIDEVP